MYLCMYLRDYLTDADFEPACIDMGRHFRVAEKTVFPEGNCSSKAIALATTKWQPIQETMSVALHRGTSDRPSERRVKDSFNAADY